MIEGTREVQKAIRKQKRKEAYELSISTLNEFGIEFTEHNNGGNLTMESNGYVIEFYPISQEWRIMNPKKEVGIHTLIKYIKDNNENRN